MTIEKSAEGIKLAQQVFRLLLVVVSYMFLKKILHDEESKPLAVVTFRAKKYILGQNKSSIFIGKAKYCMPFFRLWYALAREE